MAAGPYIGGKIEDSTHFILGVSLPGGQEWMIWSEKGDHGGNPENSENFVRNPCP
jgi:hypothetical protein